MEKPNKQFRTIQDIYDASGDRDGLGSAAKLAAKLNIPGSTAESWRKTGVPTKHWEKVMKITGATPAEMFSITRKCRKLAQTK